VLKNLYIMKKIYLLLLLIVASCSTEEIETNSNEDSNSYVLTEFDYVFKNKTYPVTFKVFGDGSREIILNEYANHLISIYNDNDDLAEVYGLELKTIFLFENDDEHLNFMNISGRGCAIQKSLSMRCADEYSGGGGGGSAISYSNYSEQNLKLYLDSHFSKQLNWTSSCYSNTGTTSNYKRMQNWAKNENSYWNFRSGQNCFPSGYTNANDKLSSFQVSPNIYRVTIYQNKDQGGKSRTFYRDVAISDPQEQRYFVDSNTQWLVIDRLKDFWICGACFTNTWDDDVSSIRLN
jgi:hypothetical protein